MFTLNYWFGQYPPVMAQHMIYILVGFFAAFIIASIVIKVLAKKHKGDKQWNALWGKLGNVFLTMGVIGLFWVFFSVERVPLFGSRFWVLVWVLVTGAWSGTYIYYVKKVLPKQSFMARVPDEISKYLPKKKKK